MNLMMKMMINSTELYQKTRAKASKVSKQRADSVDLTPIHPLLLSHLPQEELSLERVCEDIHAYRPPSTIWEMERGKSASEVWFQSINQSIILIYISFDHNHNHNNHNHNQ